MRFDTRPPAWLHGQPHGHAVGSSGKRTPKRRRRKRRRFYAVAYLLVPPPEPVLDIDPPDEWVAVEPESDVLPALNA